MKPITSSATISTTTITSTMDSTNTIDRLAFFETFLNGPGPSFEITLSNIEMPYRPTSGITDIPAVVLRLDSSSREIKEIFKFVKGTDTTA
jgi:hypothetical protein